MLVKTFFLFAGPVVELDRRKIDFLICKNVDETRKAVINIINKSFVETTYRWFLPSCGQGSFQVPNKKNINLGTS